jgi:hypothetical protein
VSSPKFIDSSIVRGTKIDAGPVLRPVNRFSPRSVGDIAKLLEEIMTKLLMARRATLVAVAAPPLRGAAQAREDQVRPGGRFA